MNRLALKMLFGDRAKYFMLISGIVLATMLMSHGGAIFCGIMASFAPSLYNIRAKIWVTYPAVECINDVMPMRDTDVGLVRSVDGVSWAVPLYHGQTSIKASTGKIVDVRLVGIDSSTLIGAPDTMVEGDVHDILSPNSIIISEYSVKQLGKMIGRPVRVGDRLEMNNVDAVVSGICHVHESGLGFPFVYTSYSSAMHYIPQKNRTLMYILVGVQDGRDVSEVAREIETRTGLKAFTETEFLASTFKWYVVNTALPMNVALIVLMGFLVGTAVSGQTFYSFIWENMGNFAAMKAMGMKTRRLCAMLILQSLIVGLVGFGIGQGVVAVLGYVMVRMGSSPFLLLWQVSALTGVAVLLICMVSAVIGITKISKIEPAVVFRS